MTTTQLSLVPLDIPTLIGRAYCVYPAEVVTPDESVLLDTLRAEPPQFHLRDHDVQFGPVQTGGTLQYLGGSQSWALYRHRNELLLAYAPMDAPESPRLARATEYVDLIDALAYAKQDGYIA